MSELSYTDKTLLKSLEHILLMDGTQVLFVNGTSSHGAPITTGVVILYPSHERSILAGMQEMDRVLHSSVEQMQHIVQHATKEADAITQENL